MQQDINGLVQLFNERRFAEVEQLAREITESSPGNGLGWKVLGASLLAQGRTLESLEPLRKAAALLPGDAGAYNNLAITLKELGRLAEAEAHYRLALRIKPDFADALSNLGNVLKDLGRPEEAEAFCRQALAARPDFAEAHGNLGNALKDQGRLQEAEVCYRRALELKPEMAKAHSNLGLDLADQGRLEEARDCLRRSLQLNPQAPGVEDSLGDVLKELGRPEEAEACYRRALELRPDCHESQNLLGNSLMDQGRLQEAADCYRRALRLKPTFPAAWNNLGNALKDQGNLEEAESCYRLVLQIKPDFAEAQSNLIFTLQSMAGRQASECFAEACKYGNMVAEKVEKRYASWQCGAHPERLRVGLVSGDLREHPVGFFLQGVLSAIDPARIELVAYATSRLADRMTARLRPFFAQWNVLAELSDEGAAARIHADGVHLLLDLSGHTSHSRLPVFAWRPAPVQVSWLGYFATTGMAEMDYLLADRVGAPESHREGFTEKLWRLPETRICFTPPEVELAVADLPALASGAVTFGCFQNWFKVGEQVLELWGEVLSALPGSRLRLQCGQLADSQAVEEAVERLRRCGIDPERVSFHGAMTLEGYLAAHAEVDLILDTFPFPGGTTTCQALWMGVPTLTLAGDTLLSRQGASLMSAAGLPDFVAQSKEDYLERAIALAGDLPKLARLRAGLRRQVLASPLFDARRFARHLEDALWGMWREAGGAASGRGGV